MARGEIDGMESSSEEELENVEETQVKEVEEEKEEEEEEEEEILDGDATHRLACVNLNWDIITVNFNFFF